MELENIQLERDYSLVGKESKLAVVKGLADATWYTSPVPREKMRELLTRKNAPAIRDSIIWFSLIFGSGYLVYVFWGTWWFIAPYMVYSVLYASTSDSRWHESSHGTAFKSDWMNKALYEIASFMVFRQSTVWRWSHTRHHSDTIIRGRDPEIASPRPVNKKALIMNLFGLKSVPAEFRKVLIHASGRIDKEVATFLPKSEYKKVIWKARAFIGVFVLVITLAIVTQSILPLLYVGLPTLVGTWLLPIYGLTQHAGLAENVLDHRLNCRTVYMNRIHRFLYWNMNYHLEHHMFPMVPYHNLPKLHELIKEDCPKPYNGIIDAYREIIPALIKQSKDPEYFVKRELPTPSVLKDDVSVKKFTASSKNIAKNGFVEVCATSEIHAEDAVQFDCNGKTFAVYRTADKQLYATDGICTHGKTHLAGGFVVGNQIECPKHNGRFNLVDGTAARSPVQVPLCTYPVKEVQGKVFMNVENPEGAGQNEKVHSFRVISNKSVSSYIRELILEPQGDNFEYQPGQYIQLEIPEYEVLFSELFITPPFDKTWKTKNLYKYRSLNSIVTRRNYSIGSNPKTEKNIRLNVRMEFPPPGLNCNAGIGSSYVFKLQPGDKVKGYGPVGDFLIKDSSREMIYVGGGAGMAPLRSHLAYLFESLHTKRKVSFWYGARSLSELFYQDYFKELEAKNDNFSFHVALSEPLPEDNWNSHTGYIHEVLHKEYLSKHKDVKNIEFYLCGPPVMVQAANSMVTELGVNQEQIAYDEF